MINAKWTVTAQELGENFEEISDRVCAENRPLFILDDEGKLDLVLLPIALYEEMTGEKVIIEE